MKYQFGGYDFINGMEDYLDDLQYPKREATIPVAPLLLKVKSKVPGIHARDTLVRWKPPFTLLAPIDPHSVVYHLFKSTHARFHQKQSISVDGYQNMSIQVHFDVRKPLPGRRPSQKARNTNRL